MIPHILRKSLKAILVSAYLLFIITNKTHAFTNPQLYYDWNHTTTLSVLGFRISAQTKSADDYKTLDVFSHKPKFLGNLLPGDTFYFLKNTQENISLTLTTNAKEKTEKKMQLSAVRIDEIKKLIEKDNQKNTQKAVEKFKKINSQIASELQDNFDKDDNKLSSLEKENAKQLLVLNDVATASPDSFSEVIDKAVHSSENIADSISDEKEKPVVPQEVSDRLQALKAQGLLTSEEVASIIGVDTRTQLRERLKDYVNKKLFPQADYKKLDEGIKEHFPTKFVELIELKKFEELKELESDKPDDETLEKIQEFAKNYEPGDIVPPELKKWWVPLVRLEELQNTIRLDLINNDAFKDKPEYTQKFTELIERVKPTQDDIDYIDDLIERNSKILNDPFYARMKALAEEFGTSDTPPPAGLNCGSGQHWVNIIFMPQGGYCVPNIEYEKEDGTDVCPPGYHKPGPEADCTKDNTNVSSVKDRAKEDCPSGYAWVKDAFGGFCEPEFSSDTGGAYPSPVFSPAYCPPGQIFKDGSCTEYIQAPSEGCPENQFWNGESCVTEGSSGFSYCSKPINGCPGGRWDEVICNCIYEPTPTPTSIPGSSESTSDSPSSSSSDSGSGDSGSSSSVDSSSDSGGGDSGGGSSEGPGTPTDPPTCDITSCPAGKTLQGCMCVSPPS